MRDAYVARGWKPIPCTTAALHCDEIPIYAVTGIDFQIDVANRDYHYLSQSEIAGGKRSGC